MTLNDVILLPRANFTIIYHNTVKTIAITITIKMPSRNLKALANPSRKKKKNSLLPSTNLSVAETPLKA